MKKAFKKGFTLVELLVVIAILAILATVSIVGYTKFMEKAKASNDASLTTQMNKALQANGVTDKNETLSEAREDLLEFGVDIEKASPTADGYHYVWDSATDTMVLLNENQEVVIPENYEFKKENAFAIINAKEDIETWAGYSLYLTEKYTETELSLTTLVGVDTGSSAVVNIKYNVEGTGTKKTIIVNTNGGTLEVNAPDADIKHYGLLNEVDLLEVASASYHEFGKVIGNIKLTKGHVAIEVGAEAPTIIIAANNAEDVSITINTSEKVSVRAIVEAVANAIETIVTGSGNKDVSKEVFDTETTELFAGGLGTEDSPYLVSTAEHFENIDDDKIQNDMKSGKEYYFELTNNIKLNKAADGNKSSIIGLLRGEVNGNGNQLITDGQFMIFSYSVGNTEIKDLKVLNTGFQATMLIYQATRDDGITIFNNVDIYGENDNTFSFGSQRVGSYAYQAFGDITFKDCDNYMNISDNNSTGIFLSNYPYANNNGVILSYENCKNYGSVSAPSVGFFIGNSNHKKYIIGSPTEKELGKVYLVINNCSNEGQILATTYSGPINLFPASNQNNQTYIQLNKDIIDSSEYYTGFESIGTTKPSLTYDNNYMLIIGEPSSGAYSSYELAMWASVSFTDGSGYVKIVHRIEKGNENTNIPYISKILTDKTYKEEYGIDYSNIVENEQIDENGQKYKITKYNEEYIVVVTEQSILSIRAAGAKILYLEKTFTYQISCVNENLYVGSNVYSKGNVPA